MIPTDLARHLQDELALVRRGDLAAATAAIRQRLAGAAAPVPARDAASEGRVLEGDFRVMPDAANDEAPGDAATPDARDVDQVRVAATFSSRHGDRDYLLYRPAVPTASPAPLLLMMHGCTQDAADFARGTRMHVRAAAERYTVVYVTQPASANGNKCWNWFQADHQRRDGGEPALLAELAIHLAESGNVDRDRVFVAGLSAGGAMALNVAQLYPEVFRAVGAHSALPPGSAHDLPSALSAMRAGAIAGRAAPRGVPVIVLHGDRDTTVHPNNAAVIAERAEAAANDAGARWETMTTAAGVATLGYTTRRLRDADGRLRAEHWVVHGGGHAWFGGSREGTFVDPRAPDASEAMLRFFRDLR